MRTRRHNLRPAPVASPTPSVGTALATRLTVWGPVTALVLAIVGGVALAFNTDPPVVPQTHAVIGVDASSSSSPVTRCEDLGRLAVQVVENPKRRVDLALVATGDRLRGNQLQRLGAWSRDAGAMSVRRVGGALDKDSSFVASVEQACQSMEVRNESPLLETLRAELAMVRSKGDCAAQHVICSVVLRSDLVEEVDPTLVAALQGSTSTSERAPRLDNQDVDVILCGLSERQVKRTAKAFAGEAIERAWRPEFSEPERVRFEPACAPFVNEDALRSLSAIAKDGV